MTVAVALLSETAFPPGVFGILLRVTTLAYAALLAVLLIVLEWWGERHWVLSLLLFAPAWLLLTPLLLLTPVSLLFRRWRLCLVQLGCVAVVLFGYMTFHWRPQESGGPGALTVVTHNIGDWNRQQFEEFLSQLRPDIILLQDASGKSGEFGRRYPDFHVAARGEFVCISRFPIQQSALLDQPRAGAKPVAARFEVLFEGKPLALYSVHMPTPRAQFNRFLSRRVLTDIADKKEASPTVNNYKDWIAERIELARSLANRISGEKQPFIAAGDFNMPDRGLIYHMFAREMTDAFAHAGRGWGLTFPGEMDNRVAFLGPWLRIDFIFAGKGWTPLFCEPESGSKSQHRAVMARLQSASAS